MEILYFMVYLSLGLSFSFLAFFFWAVNTDQWSSLDSASVNLLEEDNNIKGQNNKKGQNNE